MSILIVSHVFPHILFRTHFRQALAPTTPPGRLQSLTQLTTLFPWKFFFPLVSRTPPPSEFVSTLLQCLLCWFLLFSLTSKDWSAPNFNPQTSSLFLSTLTHILGDLIQSHGFKYHLYANDFQICISHTTLFPELETYISNLLLTAPFRNLIGISMLACPSLHHLSQRNHKAPGC